MQPSSYPINTIFLWTGGSHEGVLQVALRPERGIRSNRFEERLRGRFQREVSRRAVLVRARRHRQPHPELRRADAGRSRGDGSGFRGHRTFAAKLRDELGAIPRAARPAVRADARLPRRSRSTSIGSCAGQLGVTVDQVGRSFAAATSSSRFVAPNYWADPRTGIAFQVQVEVPQPRMTSARGSAGRAGERRTARRSRCSATSRTSRTRRSSASTTASTASGWSPSPPTSPARISAARSTQVERGDRARRCAAARGDGGGARADRARWTRRSRNISAGLAVAVVVIFLLLAANFQSIRLAFVVVSTVPAVLAGVDADAAR